jgi:hypothetical protein
MSRLGDLNWRRILYGCALIGVAVFTGFFQQRPRHEDNERYVQSNYQRDSGKWTKREVTGADLNQMADKAQPLNQAITAVLALGGVVLVAFELRHLKK